MYIGVDYYPEHWDRKRWTLDAKLMREAGFNVVRMAEFAWVKMEPVEGRYDFGWLDYAIEILHSNGISAVLGTPTGSMPAWVYLKYPDTVAVDSAGNKIPYGSRKNNCPVSASFRLLSRNITSAMAEHYKKNKAVIGWQTDNEFSGPVCFCKSCETAWHEYLKEKYRNVDELNRRWGTIFWSHTYGDWDEIPLPKLSYDNPSLFLEHKRFHSKMVVDFQKEQIDILKRTTPVKFVTHNLMGFAPAVDYFDLSADLDFISWDCYYNFVHWQKRYDSYVNASAGHDLMRCAKKKNFWIMETSAGPIGNRIYSRNVRPGEMRRMNFQAVAHGADGLVYFRWRTCRFGLEQYWHGLLGHDGVPARRYKEAKRVAGDFHRIAKEVEGSVVKSDVAILHNYDDRWALEIQPNADGFVYVDHMLKYYSALQREGLNVDMVKPDDNLDGYKVVIYPTGYVLTEKIAKNIENYVKNGGILLTTFRTGVKDEDNIPHDMVLPGFFRKITGIRIEEYESLSEPWAEKKDTDKYKVAFIRELGGKTYAAGYCVDWVIPEKASVLAEYDEIHLKGFAGVTEHKFGKGMVVYIGCQFLEDEPYRIVVKRVLGYAGIKSPVNPPDNVEAFTRSRGETRYMFLINHNEEGKEIDVSGLPARRDLVSGRKVKEKLFLAGNEVAILKYREKK